MIKSFCIAGDSWACGEWNSDDSLYPGGKQYDLHRFLLAANFVVSDISLPGEHNSYTIDRLKRHLEQTPFDYDYVIWFQSDPLRRPEFIDVLNNAKDFSLDYNYFVDISNKYLEEEYKNLNSLGKTVYCIGGLSKLNLDLLKGKNNLVPLLESVVEFLYPDELHPPLCVGEWMLLLNRQVELSSLDKIKNDHESMSKWATIEYSSFFNVGDSHPNRHAYKKLFDYIISNIEKFKRHI